MRVEVLRSERTGKAHRAWGTFLVGAVIFQWLAGPALADTQTMLTETLTSDMIRGVGWEQLTDLPEMTAFFLALVQQALMTAAIAFHPVLTRSRETIADFDEPRSLFIYSLVGMIVGFMVLNHGYLIGFVIFGIGGLVRFKSDAGEMADNRRLILVMLIGLCSGLDLPVMALLATTCAWLIIYGLGRTEYHQIEVHFENKKLAQLNTNILRDLLGERSFKVVTVTKQRFKPGAIYLIQCHNGKNREAIAREMAAIQGMKVHGIDEWHVE